MYGYIYITQNKLNGKKYIGKHKAENFDESYFGSGKALKSAIKLYGKSNFECKILDQVGDVPTICYTAEELNLSEKYYIDYYNCVSDRSYYNMKLGGDGGLEFINKNNLNCSESAKEKRNKTMMERYSYCSVLSNKDVHNKSVNTRKQNGSYENQNWALNKTEEEMQKISKKAVETKRKKYNGSIFSEQGSNNIKNSAKNRVGQKRSQETKMKISEKLKISSAFKNKDVRDKAVRTRRENGSYIITEESKKKRDETMLKNGTKDNWQKAGTQAALSPEAKLKRKLYWGCIKESKALYGDDAHWRQIRKEKYGL